MYECSAFLKKETEQVNEHVRQVLMSYTKMRWCERNIVLLEVLTLIIPQKIERRHVQEYATENGPARATRPILSG